MAGHTYGDEREKPTTQITVPSKDLKAERIQHHQTSSSTNAKESSLDKKHRKGF